MLLAQKRRRLHTAEIESLPFTSHYTQCSSSILAGALAMHSWEISSRASRIAQPNECERRLRMSRPSLLHSKATNSIAAKSKSAEEKLQLTENF
jgi:hypothetical protein